MTKEKKLLIGLTIFFAIFFYIVRLMACQDNDMYFEIVSGRDILNGNFYNPSKLSDTSNVVIQQWLYSVCMVPFDNLGYAGHMLLVFIQNIILYLVSSQFIYIKTKDKTKSIIGPIIAILVCNGYMINIRPQIITAICLIVELIILEKYKETQKYIWWLVPLFIISVNFHQSLFLYHFLVLLPYYYNKKIDWKLIFISPLLLLCSLLTPYGIDGPLYIVKSFTSGAFDYFLVSELQSLNVTTVIGAIWLCTLIITIYLVYKHKTDYKANYFIFTLSLLLLLSVRHFSIYIIAILFLICCIEFKFNIIIGLISIILCVFSSLGFYSEAYDQRQDNAEMLNYIQKDDKIFNVLNIGGYLEYNDYTVLSDIRPELFTEKFSNRNILEEISKVYYGKDHNACLVSDEEILNIVKDYDCLILYNESYFGKIKSEWKQVYKDNTYTIYRKAN